MLTKVDRRGFLATTGGMIASNLASVAGTRAAVGPGKGLVTGQPEAAEAGQAVLAAGGNAVDAVVAAALVAGVVAVQGTGIAGYGGHLVVAKPDGKVFAIDFNSTAPEALKPDTFVVDANGNVKGERNTYGWLAAGVPGVLAGLQLAIDRFGTRSFAEVAVYFLPQRSA